MLIKGNLNLYFVYIVANVENIVESMIKEQLDLKLDQGMFFITKIKVKPVHINVVWKLHRRKEEQYQN